MSVKKFGIGQPMRRVEDHRLLTGGGRYTDDYSPDKALHAVVLRSPHAHAKFTFTDLETARAMKGVKLVMTAAEVAHLGDVPCQGFLPNSDGTQSHIAHIPVLAKGVAKHVGDAVAFVVAETLRAPAMLPRPSASTIPCFPRSSTCARRSPRARPPCGPSSPTIARYDIGMGDKAEVDGIFAKADKVVKIEIENNRLITNYMETRGVVAEYDSKLKTSSSRSAARASTASATRWRRTCSR